MIDQYLLRELLSIKIYLHNPFMYIVYLSKEWVLKHLFSINTNSRSQPTNYCITMGLAMEAFAKS